LIIISRRTHPASVREVIFIDERTVIALVLGVAMLVVAIVGLVVKLIELSRK
jgi:hypothetical protein